MKIHKTVFFAALTLAAASIHAQNASINYVWIGGQSGNWNTLTNWSPNPTEIIGGSSGGDTSYDRVTISGADVTRSGHIYFNTRASNDPRDPGTVNSITLLNNASLTVSGTLQVTTSSRGFIRNVSIGSGSTLTAGTIRAGTQNGTVAKSTWAINGEVNAGYFQGYQGSSTSNGASGYILNVDGGSLNVSSTFTWGHQGNADNPDRVGQINISNNGIVNIGTMAADWTDVAGNVVTFVDGTGILRFGYGNWDLAGVQRLIDNNYISKGASVFGNLQINDTGSGWEIGVTAIPEASTTAVIGGSVALALIGLRRRLHSRSK